MWVADLIAAVVALALGLAVTLFSFQLDYMAEFGPGPGILPRWIGFGITACGLVILAQVLKKNRKVREFFRPGTRMGVKILVEIIVTFLFFPVLGFSVALGIFTGVAMRTMGKHPWISCGLTAAVTAVCVHFLFGHYLDIPLPEGMIGF
jgi:putative tricarboxylic transport membrane protein